MKKDKLISFVVSFYAFLVACSIFFLKFPECVLGSLIAIRLCVVSVVFIDILYKK